MTTGTKGMLVQQKADLSAGATVSLSGMGLYMSMANKWVAEYMPLITAIGILGGLIASSWYYYQSIQQRKRDRAIEHKRLEDARAQRDHERDMKDRG